MSSSGPYSRVSTALFNQITGPHHAQDLATGAVVFQQGDSARGLYALQTGLVGLFGATASGREMLFALFRDGQFLGHRAYFSGEAYLSQARALSPCRISFVPAQAVEQLLRTEPEFSRHMLGQLASMLGSFGSRLADAADRPAPVRIAATLLYLKAFAPDHRWKRQEIADYSGSTAPTVVRTLRELEEHGYVHVAGREIEIVDPNGLRAWIA